MRCSRCGAELPDDANFCRSCGSPTRNNMEWLLQQARAKNQEALAAIYEMSSPALYKTIKVLIKDEDTVYDILQDTYVKAFTRLDQLQDAGKLIPWLKMIANNQAKDWLKKSKPIFFTDITGAEEEENTPFEEAIEDVRSDMNPELSMDQKEVQRLVMEILDQLPEDQRMVIAMFYYEEMSVKDIAATLGVSENTVKSRLSYGRKKVKEQVLDLEKRGTKLYNIAPFVFFLYLLRKVDTVSADPLDPGIFQGIMNSFAGNMPGNQFTWGNGGAYENNGNIKNNTDISGTNRNNKGNSNGVTKSGKRNSGGRKTGGSAAKTGAAKAAGTSAGAAAKYTGLKIAALILAGSLGAGGLTYGVVRNVDKLPFVQEQNAEKEVASSDKKTDSKTTDTKDTQDSKKTAKTSDSKKSSDPNAKKTAKTAAKAESAATPKPTATPTAAPTATPEPTVTPIPAENPSNYTEMPEYPKYASFIQNLCANTAGDTEIALYDIDGDGIRELIFSHGTCEADWTNDVYTLVNDSDVISIGTMYTHAEFYTAPDGNGIYSLRGHMGYEQIYRYTKNGNAINSEEISVREIGGDEDYATFDGAIKLVPVSQLSGQQDQSADSLDEEGLNLIQGTWYTWGGVPYHYKAVISGNNIKKYGPDMTEPSIEETITQVIKTDYGYYFRVPSQIEDVGYRYELSNPENLLIVGGDPYSTDGFSGTDSLSRSIQNK